MEDKDLTEQELKELKQKVNQYVFEIRRLVTKKAYWKATKESHELFELLEKLPYVEADNA